MNTIAHLRKNGNRLTKQRQIIIDTLLNFSQPVTAQEIHKYLKNKKIAVDLTSVYRTLNLLSKMDIIRMAEFGEGKKRYEIIKKDDHHHHFVCDNCGSIKDIVIDEEKKILAGLKKRNNFQIKRHSLEFFGICVECR